MGYNVRKKRPAIMLQTFLY